MTQVEDPRFAAPRDQNAPPEKEGRGCLFWGCLISGVLLLLLIVGVPLAGYFVVRHYVQQFTTEEAREIVVVELPEEQLAELLDRLTEFGEAVQAKQNPPDIALTADEVNGLIALEESLRGRVLIRIENGRVGGDLTLPADQLPGGGGRFFNLSVEFDVSMSDGRLDVRLASADLNGSPLPQQVVDAIANENLAAEAYNDPETMEFFALFESLEVIGDRIVLKAKQPAANAASDPPAPVEPPEQAAEPVDAT